MSVSIKLLFTAPTLCQFTCIYVEALCLITCCLSILTSSGEQTTIYDAGAEPLLHYYRSRGAGEGNISYSIALVVILFLVIRHPFRGPKGRGIADRQRGGCISIFGQLFNFLYTQLENVQRSFLCVCKLFDIAYNIGYYSLQSQYCKFDLYTMALFCHQ